MLCIVVTISVFLAMQDSSPLLLWAAYGNGAPTLSLGRAQRLCRFILNLCGLLGIPFRLRASLRQWLPNEVIISFTTIIVLRVKKISNCPVAY